MDNVPNLKNIVFHPCPLCKNPMEVELIEVRKDVTEGKIDLEAVKEEWRHVCTKCHHETTKYIKICKYCELPDDIEKLKCDETSKDKTYYHVACARKQSTPYIIFGILAVLMLAGILVGVKIVTTAINNDKSSTLIKKAEQILFDSANATQEQKPVYAKKREDARNDCLESIKINPYYLKAYQILGKLCHVDNKLNDEAEAYEKGYITAKHINDMKLLAYFEDELKKLKNQGVDLKKFEEIQGIKIK